MNDVVCTSCGYHGQPRAYGCMQVGLTIVLALFLLLPGILYALYIDSWRKRCPQCDQRSIIPANSPKGMQLLATLPETRANYQSDGPNSSENVAPDVDTSSSKSSIAPVVIGLLITASFGTFLAMRFKWAGDDSQRQVEALAPARMPASSSSAVTIPVAETSSTVDTTTIAGAAVEQPAPIVSDAELLRIREEREALVRERAREEEAYVATLPHVYLEPAWQMYHVKGCSAVTSEMKEVPISERGRYVAHRCVPEALMRWQHAPGIGALRERPAYAPPKASGSPHVDSSVAPAAPSSPIEMRPEVAVHIHPQVLQEQSQARPVYVRGYTRTDGTIIPPSERPAPRRH